MRIGCARGTLNDWMRLGLMKKVVKHAVPTILALCGTVSVAAHEDDGIASDCLETVAEMERWHIRNRCDVKVHIAWCEEDDDGHCAWKSGPNLEPGGTHSTGRVSDESAQFKAAGCRSDFGHGGMWGTPDQNTDAFICLTPKSGALRLTATVEDDLQDSTHCLEGIARDDQLYIQNTCDYATAMAYCDKTGLSPDHACGKDEERFYTLVLELQPGEEWGSPYDSIEAEACRIVRQGTSPFDPDGWDGHGGFECLAELTSVAGSASLCGMGEDDAVIVTIEAARTNYAGLRDLWRRQGRWEARGVTWGDRRHTEAEAWARLFSQTTGPPLPLPEFPFCTFRDVSLETTDGSIYILVDLRIYRLAASHGAATTAGAMAESYFSGEKAPGYASGN